MFSTQQYSGFDPRTIPGCALWLDAADTSTITGSPVSTWADKSGNGRNATSPSGPTVSTYNGYRVLSFNGTSQYMISTSTTVQRNAHTLIAVHVPANINGNFQGNTSLFRFQQASGYVVFPFQHGTTPRGYITSADGSGAGSIDATNSTLVENSVTTQFNLIVANITSGNQRVFRNGSQQSSDTEALSSGTTDYLTIGAFGTGSEFYQGSLAEMIIFSGALTTSEQTQVEGYLAWKWGLQNSLPTGHPFRPNPTAMRVFQPIDISGCNLWLDAMDKTTFTPANPSDGTGITAWNDKSGSNFTFSRTYGSTNATYNAASNSLFFSTSNAGYSSSHSASVTNETLFTVFTTTFNGSGYIVGATGPGGREVGLYLNWTRLGNINAGVEWAAITPNGSMTGGVRNLGVSTVSASSNLAVAVNGGTFTTYTLANPLGSNSQTSTLAVEGTTPTYSGHIHEVITYNRVLSTSERQQVEGYLATKWGTSSLLPSTQPYYLSRVLPSTPLFTPTSITGCSLWMDAADISTFTFSSGSNISQWRDKSSNAAIGSATFGATYTANAQNALPAVSFIASSNQRIDCGNVANVGTNRLYIYTISKLNVANGTIVAKGDFNGTSGTYGLFNEFGTLAMYIVNSTGGQIGFATASDTNLNTRLLTGSWERPAIRLAQNGTTLGTASLVDSGNLSNSIPLWIGGFPNYGAFLDGQIMEVVIYTGNLDTSQQQRVEGYLAWKWGLQNSLPTTHPYYKFRP